MTASVLRFANNSYLPGRDDVYVSLTQMPFWTQEWTWSRVPFALPEGEKVLYC